MKLLTILRLTTDDRSFRVAILMSITAILMLGSLSVDTVSAAQRRGKKGFPPPSSSQRSDRRDVPKGRTAANETRQPVGYSKRGVPSTALAKQKSGGSSSREDNQRTRSRVTPPPQVAHQNTNRDTAPVYTPAPVIASPTTDYSSARIETIEYGSAKYNQTTRQLSLPTTGRGSSGDSSKSRINISNRRLDVEISPERVMEIQRALIERKYLEGEPNGMYDDVTIEAMRQFQMKEQIDVTGYPTAHSLKRLGLTR